MPRKRFIEWDGRPWLLSDLARAAGLAPGTLSARLERFGEGASGIRRALCTGVQTAAQAGQRGAQASSWRG